MNTLRPASNEAFPSKNKQIRRSRCELCGLVAIMLLAGCSSPCASSRSSAVRQTPEAPPSHEIKPASSSNAISCDNESPSLAGNWIMGGPYNIGMPCIILQDGNYLTFVNEKSEKSRGVLKNNTEVIALDWEAGLSGILTDKATRINWKNGTWWLRQKQCSPNDSSMKQ